MNYAHFTVKGDFISALTKDILVTHPDSYTLYGSGQIIDFVEWNKQKHSKAGR